MIVALRTLPSPSPTSEQSLVPARQASTLKRLCSLSGHAHVDKQPPAHVPTRPATPIARHAFSTPKRSGLFLDSPSPQPPNAPPIRTPHRHNETAQRGSIPRVINTPTTTIFISPNGHTPVPPRKRLPRSGPLPPTSDKAKKQTPPEHPAPTALDAFFERSGQEILSFLKWPVLFPPSPTAMDREHPSIMQAFAQDYTAYLQKTALHFAIFAKQSIYPALSKITEQHKTHLAFIAEHEPHTPHTAPTWENIGSCYARLTQAFTEKIQDLVAIPNPFRGLSADFHALHIEKIMAKICCDMVIGTLYPLELAHALSQHQIHLTPEDIQTFVVPIAFNRRGNSRSAVCPKASDLDLNFIIKDNSLAETRFVALRNQSRVPKALNFIRFLSLLTRKVIAQNNAVKTHLETHCHITMELGPFTVYPFSKIMQQDPGFIASLENQFTFVFQEDPETRQAISTAPHADKRQMFTHYLDDFARTGIAKAIHTTRATIFHATKLMANIVGTKESHRSHCIEAMVPTNTEKNPFSTTFDHENLPSLFNAKREGVRIIDFLLFNHEAQDSFRDASTHYYAKINPSPDYIAYELSKNEAWLKSIEILILILQNLNFQYAPNKESYILFDMHFLERLPNDVRQKIMDTMFALKVIPEDRNIFKDLLGIDDQTHRTLTPKAQDILDLPNSQIFADLWTGQHYQDLFLYMVYYLTEEGLMPIFDILKSHYRHIPHPPQLRGL